MQFLSKNVLKNLSNIWIFHMWYSTRYAVAWSREMWCIKKVDLIQVNDILDIINQQLLDVVCSTTSNNCWLIINWFVSDEKINYFPKVKCVRLTSHDILWTSSSIIVLSFDLFFIESFWEVKWSARCLAFGRFAVIGFRPAITRTTIQQMNK